MKRPPEETVTLLHVTYGYSSTNSATMDTEAVLYFGQQCFLRNLLHYSSILRYGIVLPADAQSVLTCRVYPSLFRAGATAVAGNSSLEFVET